MTVERQPGSAGRQPGAAEPKRAAEAGGATRGRATRPVGRLVDRLLAQSFRRQGFAQSEVLTRWPAIVGADLARYSCPERLAFPTRARTATGAVLHVRVAGPVALEFQHRAPEIVATVNRYFGFAAVQRLSLVQGPLPPVRPERVPPAEPPPSPAVERLLAPLDDGPVKAALERLGRRIAAARR